MSHSLTATQVHDGRSPTARFRRRIAKRFYEICLLKYAPNNLALHPNPPPVNNPQCAESHPVRFFQISFHYAPDIARRKGMEIENVGDGNANRLIAH